NDHNNDNRGNRNGDNRRNDRRGGFSAGGDNVMNTKESRSNNNRHNKNREFNKNDNRGGYNAYSNGPKHNKKNKQNNKKTNIQPPKPQQPKEEKVDEIRNIILPNPCTMKELADACKVTPAVIIKKLFLDGKMVTINTEFSFEDAAEIAMDYNCIAEEEVKVDRIEELLKEEDEDESKMVPRPPVVCVMGHVDHGKTSLLDRIRKTHVTEGEAGGITQHIGAYVVPINGEKITFLDTPGHEAFTSMRLRGAQATDIAVLVVAADDGVMPQTIEAINHAKSAGVEVIVAVNKIDKEGANIDRVKQELTEYGLVADDWGGTTSFVPVSAKTGEGISDLLETITLTAEIMELKANPDRLARGLVIEAKLDKGRGPVATILIQKGTLHVGDTINVGHTYGRVRAMVNDKGQRVKSAGPSVPVEILGLNDVPFSGDTMIAHESEKEARSTAEAFVAYSREKMIEDTKSKLSLDDLFDQIQAGKVKELNLIVKADVQGSVEAVKQSLEKLSNEEVKITVIHGAVGAINESDVTLAAASNAIIIGFNVRPDSLAKAMAEREKIDMRLYRVIYNAIEDIEAAMKGMLDPVYQEKVIGHLDVRQLYKASGVGTIAGCYVTDGSVTKDSQVRLVRDGIVVYEGTLASLKRFKDDAKEVKQGFECGIVFEKFNDIKEGDQVEAFVMEEIPR
ncbi:MAG: translation initiation factor IF-2, partial [Lachnospiraceae bacterium]|nr:translation initiation factor IF-2 [Lachnospiraceae bacterium]